MKHRLALPCIALLLGLSSLLMAQSQRDQLLQDLQRPLSERESFETLIELASQYTHSYPDSTLHYTQEALSLARQIGDSSLLAVAYNRLGAGFWSTGELRKGLNYFEQSKAAAEAIGDTYLMARNIGNMGLIYSASGNYEAAISYYQESLIYFRELDNQERIAVTFNNTGKAYMGLGRYDSARKYLKASIDLLEAVRPNILGIVTFNLADAYYRSRAYDLALRTLEQCLEYQKTYRDLRTYIRANQLLAELDLRHQRLDSALVRAKRAASLSETSSIKELRYITYETLARALAARGQYEAAYRYHELFADYKDSVLNLETQNRLDFFDYERKQQQIALLQQERAYEKSQAQRRRLLIFGLIAGLMLAVMLGVTFFRSQLLTKRVNSMLREKNREIEEQKQAMAEQAEQLSELNMVKDRLFSIISHDLRSPLRNLGELLTLTREGSLPPEQFQTFVPELVQKVDHTTDLLDNLLIWAESQMNGVKVLRRNFALHQIVQHKVAFFRPSAERKQIKLSHQIEAALTVFADQNMIEIVLQNLMANALKFSCPGDEVQVSIHQRGDMAEVMVKDTGIGISAENRAQLFSRGGLTTLGTQNEKGTGLGLALCKDFVERNHGHIWVESTPGEGSTFGFTLPLAQLVAERPSTSGGEPI